jgi:hypothetical protein
MCRSKRNIVLYALKLYLLLDPVPWAAIEPAERNNHGRCHASADRKSNRMPAAGNGPAPI